MLSLIAWSRRLYRKLACASVGLLAWTNVGGRVEGGGLKAVDGIGGIVKVPILFPLPQIRSAAQMAASLESIKPMDRGRGAG